MGDSGEEMQAADGQNWVGLGSVAVCCAPCSAAYRFLLFFYFYFFEEQQDCWKHSGIPGSAACRRLQDSEITFISHRRPWLCPMQNEAEILNPINHVSM